MVKNKPKPIANRRTNVLKVFRGFGNCRKIFFHFQFFEKSANLFWFQHLLNGYKKKPTFFCTTTKLFLHYKQLVYATKNKLLLNKKTNFLINKKNSLLFNKNTNFLPNIKQSLLSFKT
jgi:hypothetical protein